MKTDKYILYYETFTGAGISIRDYDNLPYFRKVLCKPVYTHDYKAKIREILKDVQIFNRDQKIKKMNTQNQTN